MARFGVEEQHAFAAVKRACAEGHGRRHVHFDDTAAIIEAYRGV